MDGSCFCWSSATLSDVGLVRRLNEDACLDQPERGLWAVADGMGGHACGGTASRMVVDALAAIAPSPSAAPAQAPTTAPAAGLDLLVAAIHAQLALVNRQLRAAAGNHGAIIGSTVVVLAAVDDDCAVLWAGDSRLYLVRAGSMVQLTRDHSQREARRTASDGAPGDPGSPHAPALPNVITRAVGAADLLALDEIRFTAQDGDMLLLCSDGLTNVVTDSEIHRILLSANCRYAAQALVALALQHGGRDNISVVIVSAEDCCSADKTVLNPAV